MTNRLRKDLTFSLQYLPYLTFIFPQTQVEAEYRRCIENIFVACFVFLKVAIGFVIDLFYLIYSVLIHFLLLFKLKKSQFEYLHCHDNCADENHVK